MSVFLFSLAGIPPLGGWFAKFAGLPGRWSAAETAAGYAVAVIVAVNSVIALYYYANIARQMLFEPDPDGDTTPVKVPSALAIALGVTASPPCSSASSPAPWATSATPPPTSWPSPPDRGALDVEPISVSAFVERALYDPATGFYERGGRAGRRGDFVTSPEVGPLFGAVFAGALDGWWEAAGPARPVRGARARRRTGDARPGCRAGPAPVRAVPAMDPGREGRGPAGPPRRPPAPRRCPRGRRRLAGARWRPPGGERGARPGGPVHVVVANELLDNLPFDLAQRHDVGWDEVRLVEGPDRTWTEVLVPLDGTRADLLDRLVPGAAPGARAPLQGAAGEWVAAGLGQLTPGGRLVVLDYGATTAELAARPWAQWVRTYRGHDRGGAPWSDPGHQDVTVEVAWDQVGGTSRPPDRLRPQAEALRAWGIDALVEEGRRLWRERTGPADLAALRARSRVGESEALMDPGGLGGFTVAEWNVGP